MTAAAKKPPVARSLGNIDKVTKAKKSKKPAKGGKAGDRPHMDMSGSRTNPKGAAKNWLGKQAEADRANTKTQHANTGLTNAKEAISKMAKAVAHGTSSDDDAMKMACLSETADMAATIVDDCRRAVRNTKAEKRNMQPGPKK